jgi:hypothetical protein
MRGRSGSKRVRGGSAETEPCSQPIELDPAEIAQLERNLALTHAERLDQLVRAVAFIRAGQAELARRDE